jgi:hypothetical protein
MAGSIREMMMIRSMLALSEVEGGVRAINESHLAWYAPAQRQWRNRRDSFVLSRHFRQAWAERRLKAAVEARQVLERVKSYWGETFIGKLAADWLGSTVMGDDPAIPYVPIFKSFDPQSGKDAN